MLNQLIMMLILALSLTGCAKETNTERTINCSVGTFLADSGDTCKPNLSEGVSISEAGRIVANATSDTETALAAAREEGRTAGLAEGAASVDITSDNQDVFDEGAASVDITSDNQAAYDAGAASVTPLNCVLGTAVNAAGDACEPTAEYRAAAVEEGRVAGAASVTPLNCALGTEENGAGDVCIPSLGDDVEVTEAGLIVSLIEPIAVVEGASGSCMRVLVDSFGIAPHEIQFADCPAGTYPSPLICTATRQMSSCHLKECIPNDDGSCEMTCDAEDIACFGLGDPVNIVCNDAICEDGGAENSHLVCNGNANCTATAGSNQTTCNAGASCQSYAGTGDDIARQTCGEGATCECSASTGDAQCVIECQAGAVCSASASTGDSKITMNCAANATCRCSTSVINSQCIMTCAEGADCACIQNGNGGCVIR
jgi:hypothetical protein